MDSGASKPIEMAALGRPFSLGMLYDCRQDSLIPGLTLWDREALEKDTGERPNHNTEFEIIASDSIEDKSSALNVEASLKASFLCGLVKVEGSAKYLTDSRISKNQARVTLKYKTTTKFKELSMNHLGRGNVTYPYVFEEAIATHVVTGILYGAQAFFVFDREVSDKDDRQDIEGNLKVMIKKIPSLTVEGQGRLQMGDTDTANVEKFSCKFHGDFSLENNPVTFQEAIKVYQSLPKLLGEHGEKAVPLKIWLTPLKSLDSAAAQLVRQISLTLVSDAQSVLEDLSELEMRCNDIMKNTIVQQFLPIGKKLKAFKKMCLEYKLEFQRTLAKKLPAIRGGGEEESGLAEILKKRHTSPFNNRNLSEWMDCKEREINVLRSLTDMMKNTKIVSTQSALDKEVLSPDAKHLVCFAFTSLESGEAYLSDLSNYLREAPRPENMQGITLDTHDVEVEQWYFSSEVSATVRQKAKLFIDFAEANRDNKNVQFRIAAIPNERQKGASVYLYKDGVLVNENFEPPSKPKTPALSATTLTHNSLAVKMHPTKFGMEDVIHYSVEYCIKGKDGWKQEIASKAEQFTMSNLTPNTEYLFKYGAVCSAGQGPKSEVSPTIKTLPTSPPGQLQIESYSTELSVNWQKPTEIGEGVNIDSYIVEYTEVYPETRHEEHEWKKMMSKAEKAIISELQPMTEYTVRVSCDCGPDGRSKESDPSNVRTTKREFVRLAEFFKQKAKLMKSDSPSVYMLPLEEKGTDLDGCKRYSFGKESMRRNRTIMVLGATGAGKSTLINGMINYILGVEWNDDFRFNIIDDGQLRSQAESQTSEVTVYEINHQEGFKIPYSVTIVDTPGFGDTRGIDRDKIITEQIRSLFTSMKGVCEIDAVCFVTQASLARLTPTQKYVFDSVLSIFGKDVAENIQMLVTFADGQQPPVLEAINVCGVPCPKTELGLPINFKFNNSALFADNRSISAMNCDKDIDEDDDEDDDNNFDQMFWIMGVKSMRHFFSALDKMTTKSLQLTKEVLKERKQLETAVEGLQPQVKAGLAKLEEIKMTKQQILQHEADISSNENFEIEVDVIKPVQKKLSKAGDFITNCQQCSVTCHDPCAISNDSEKHGCASMGTDGKCTVCPGKCIWSVHFNQKYRWDYVQVKEKRTVQELKNKYQKATKEKMSIQELVETQEEEIANLQDVIVTLMDQSAHCLARLKDIALKPNPLTTPEYIDFLIDGEKSEAKTGYKARIQSLKAMKTQAIIISKVAKREKLSKTEEEMYEEKQQRQKKQGILQKITDFFFGTT